MFHERLEKTLQAIYGLAKTGQHEYITVEHLLMVLLDDAVSVEALKACKKRIPVKKMKTQLAAYLKKYVPKLPKKSFIEARPDIDFQTVLQRAIFQAQAASETHVLSAHFLYALFHAHKSYAVSLLTGQNITRLSVLSAIKTIKNGYESDVPDFTGLESAQQQEMMDVDHMMMDEQQGMGNPWGGVQEDASFEGGQGQSMIEKYAENMNKRVQKSRADAMPLIGRDCELQRTMQVLCRKQKSNPLFVGEPGVGKTALVEGLVQRIVDGKVPDLLKNKVVYQLDLSLLLAGTKYRGDFEKRFKQFLKVVAKDEKIILFVDEIHTIIGAGAASGGTLDAANILKPALANGDVSCIGATTYAEFRNVFSKDKALVRRFQNINLKEPSDEETLKIIQGVAPHYEKHHNVRYTPSALKETIRLSKRYTADRFFPDKAIDVIDEAGAKKALLSSEGTKTVGKRDIQAAIAHIARVPKQQVALGEQTRLLDLELALNQKVFGQEEAIRIMCNHVLCARAGLRQENKPIGAFLCVGSTGIGKTELAVQLAKHMHVKLLRYDMSEFNDKSSATRLIGAPPGYVGFDQGGQLTEDVIKHPHSVLLLDEIEKANGDILNLLLQIMDSGRLTDHYGRTADFRQTIILMTSNAGAVEQNKQMMGFADGDAAVNSNAMRVIESTFSPEFRNRLDAMISFRNLALEHIHSIVDRYLLELQSKLDDRNIRLVIDTEAKDWLATHGFSKTFGARPLGRLINQSIREPLARRVMADRLRHTSVHVVVEEDKIALKLTAPRPEKKCNSKKIVLLPNAA